VSLDTTSNPLDTYERPFTVFWRRARANRLARAGSIILMVVICAAVFGPMITPYDPQDMDFMARLSPPSKKHWLGTDNYGRDLLSRILAGTRISLAVGASVMAITVALGLIFGLIAGYYSALDNPIMRIMDALMSFPATLLAVAIMAALGPSTSNAVYALAIVYTPRVVRVVRSTVLTVRNAEYVQAARVQGATDLRIIVRHILPNCLSPLLVQETFIFAYAILAEAGLSFVGAGAPPPTPSWGNILSEGRTYMREAPWLSIFPGIAIAISVLGLNLTGDGLRDVLDPRMKE